MKEPAVTSALAREHGLTEEEFQKAQAILGRCPSFTELGIFSAMWSEHCSYKSSKVHLKRLPTQGPQVVIGPGENAGVVDLGDGLCAAFKMESHNHPSFIEPYQGAATGVGGILRDVFTMGARPVANLNALRFGEPKTEHMKYLIRGVTKGVGDYGNCMGIPTVGGEVFFNEAFKGNILVNAMTVGLVTRDGIFLGEASGPGNAVVYVGAKTGRDGIHGATMASEEFNQTSEEKRPTVQVGDPFTEKLLLEALMELFPLKLVEGIQDMGAAGLTSSAFEMAGRAGSGIELELGMVPVREQAMSPYEIMLSESQERMLLVCRPAAVAKIVEIFGKWDLSAAVIGRVTETGKVMIRDQQGRLVVDMPVGPLADQAPAYHRPYREPADFQEHRRFSTAPYQELVGEKIGATLKTLLQTPNIASKRWFYRQYDHTVQTNTLLGPDRGEAALVRIKGTSKAIAITVDCNPRFVSLDPCLGAAHAVAECARNISCTGALPLAITDCLNFGNPEVPEVMWQFKRAVDGMIEACTALNTPVVSGNVSFYNETNGQPVLPTPAVGMVGLLADRRRFAGNTLTREGLVVYLLGETKNELGGSEFLDRIHQKRSGALPELDLEKEGRLQALLREAIAEGWVEQARDCSLGGLAVALAKLCFGHRPLGLRVDLTSSLPTAALLFGETASRVLVAVDPRREHQLTTIAERADLPCSRLGTAGGTRLVIDVNGDTLLDEAVNLLADLWLNALEVTLA